jgi:N6-L-threonylcarbamoyladenine synthase
MKILAIETSCDDTGIAILEVHPVKYREAVNFSKKNLFDRVKGEKDSPNFDALSNIVSSQIEVHKKYGGVYPAMAKREHQKNLIPTLVKALKQSRLINLKALKNVRRHNLEKKLKVIQKILEREPELYKKIIPFLQKYEKLYSESKIQTSRRAKGANRPDIDLISVTNGPGLEPCLWVGVNFAKVLSYFWNIPIVPVSHIESHILINFLNRTTDSSMGLQFPAIALVVSGGHTQIILMKKIGSYRILGETRDDAAGECFDKCAKILGLGYPGGPIISKLAEGIETKKFLPRPMINTKDYDFSFSGLKTAVLYHHRKQPVKIQKSKKYIQEMCAEIQQAVIDVLVKKTMKAVKDFNAKSLILGGGVSANSELRRQFRQALNNSTAVELFVPEANLSTDNALMTAITGYYHRDKKISWSRPTINRGRGSSTKSGQNLEAKANLRIE